MTATAPVRAPRRAVNIIAAGIASLLGLTLIGIVPLGPVDSAAAAPVLIDNATAYLRDYAGYKGVSVDHRVTGGVPGVAEVQVTVHRSSGGDVIKMSRSDGSVPGLATAGSSITTPIIIVPGTYDEAGSSSWWPAPAVWTVDTVPTTVDVQYLDADEEVLAEVLGLPINPAGHDLDAMLEMVPQISKVDPYFVDSASYKGIGVDFTTRGITNAVAVLVEVFRTTGGLDTKSSKPAAAFIGTLNAGAPATFTAPIVIQPGTYDEAGSGSWNVGTGTWTDQTEPVSVRVTITRSAGADLVSGVVPIGNPFNVVLADILPASAAAEEEEEEGLAATGSADALVPTGLAGMLLLLGAGLLLVRSRRA